jgi:hypothetical protein
VKRWPPLVLIVALLVGGLIVGRDGSTRAEVAPDTVDPATLLPVAAPSDALDGSWFCAGQSAGDDTPADGTVVVANVGDTDATGTIEVVAAGGDEPVVEPLDVPARTTERIRLADLLEADWVAAQVQVEGGTVVVEHEVVGEHGRDVAPCQSRASDRWLLPAGASTRDASFTLALYNPYAGEARVDLSFATEDSVRQPTDFQGLAIGPGQLVAVDVSAVVTERAVIATTVDVTRGQVVVDRIQTYDGQGAATTDEEAEAEVFAREGLTITPGVPAAQQVWAFPASLRSTFVSEEVVVFNPRDEAAEVEISVDLDDPQRNGTLDPLPLTVPPGEFAVFDVDAVESIPTGVTHSLTVRSENGVPVVAERMLSAGGEEAPYIGTAASTGSPVASERWAFATGPSAEDESGRLVVTNPGTEPVDVELAAFGDGDSTPVGADADGGDTSAFTLEPGARREVVVEDLDDDQRSLEVTATGPVVAERRVFATSSEEVLLGTSVAVGIPLRQGLVLLD